MRRFALALWAACALACTTTYGPENPPVAEPVKSDAPCEIGDTRPGCSAEATPCANPHDYLCE